jgi:TolA-binding protein
MDIECLPKEVAMRRVVLSFCILFCLIAGLPAAAQTEVGEVSFANSGAAAAQETFLRGLALLHNFEYPDAAEQFRKAQAIDPSDPLAREAAHWLAALKQAHSG